VSGFHGEKRICRMPACCASVISSPCRPPTVMTSVRCRHSRAHRSPAYTVRRHHHQRQRQQVECGEAGGEVDPRTGRFGASLNLASIVNFHVPQRQRRRRKPPPYRGGFPLQRVLLEALRFGSLNNLKRDIAQELAARNEHLNRAGGGAFRHFGGDLGVRYEGEG
jgi:hypothetical protein